MACEAELRRLAIQMSIMLPKKQDDAKRVIGYLNELCEKFIFQAAPAPSPGPSAVLPFSASKRAAGSDPKSPR